MNTQNNQLYTVSTDDWNEAFFFLLIRARGIYQNTGEIDADTVPQLLELFDLAHSKGLKPTGMALLTFLITGEDVEPDEVAATAYMLKADGLINRSDFERVFHVESNTTTSRKKRQRAKAKIKH